MRGRAGPFATGVFRITEETRSRLGETVLVEATLAGQLWGRDQANSSPSRAGSMAIGAIGQP